MKDDERDDITPEERARASRLARLVDDMLGGEPAPPALDADDRSLLETATAIHAAMGKATLEPAQTSRLVEAAFATPGAVTLPFDPARRSWLRRRGPWLVAAVSAAAAILFVLADPVRRASPGAPETAARPTPDQLVGRIDKAQAGEAGRRMDVIYADRLAGYRSARWRKAP